MALIWNVAISLLGNRKLPVSLTSLMQRFWPDNLFKLRLRVARYSREERALRHSKIVVTARKDDRAERHWVSVSRSGARLQLSCHTFLIEKNQLELYHRLRAVMLVAASVPSETFQAIAEVSDGEDSGHGTISFCSYHPGAVLIPDHAFVCSRGYQSFRQFAIANRVSWKERRDEILWRGSTTGVGLITKEKLSADDPDLILRVRCCLLLKGTSGTDCRLSQVVQSADKTTDTQKLSEAGLLAAPVAPIYWYSLKFALDIDGNSNAWSNLYTRLIMGCCVIKVASPQGYRQWYYDCLKPWIHYIPVRADLLDLVEKITWCRDNPAECERIAGSGQALALSLDYETEITTAGRHVYEAHQQGLLCTSL